MKVFLIILATILITACKTTPVKSDGQRLFESRKQSNDRN